MNNDQRDGQNRFLANSPPATEANRGNPGVGGGLGKLNGFNDNRLTGFPNNNDQNNLNVNSLSTSNNNGGGRFKEIPNDIAVVMALIPIKQKSVCKNEFSMFDCIHIGHTWH